MWPYSTSSYFLMAMVYLISLAFGQQEKLQSLYGISDFNSENNQIAENDISIYDNSRVKNTIDKVNDCHKVALWHCGHALLKASKFLDYLIGKESLYAKCSMKKAFLNCLNEMSSKKCNGRKRRNLHRTSVSKFKKKVARVLWSTRNCFLAPFFVNQLET